MDTLFRAGEGALRLARKDEAARGYELQVELRMEGAETIEAFEGAMRRV